MHTNAKLPADQSTRVSKILQVLVSTEQILQMGKEAEADARMRPLQLCSVGGFSRGAEQGGGTVVHALDTSRARLDVHRRHHRAADASQQCGAAPRAGAVDRVARRRLRDPIAMCLLTRYCISPRYNYHVRTVDPVSVNRDAELHDEQVEKLRSVL